MITTFHSLSVSDVVISGYPSIVFIMSVLMFFNKNIVCMLLVLAFIANTLNLIIKSTIYFLLYLNVSIFHSTSVTLLLLLNMVLISLMNSSQYWKSSSSFIWLGFSCVYITAISLLSQARIAVILLSVVVTLLLLRNNQILLYQSSNFILLP